MELNSNTKFLAVSAVPIRGFRRSGFHFLCNKPTLIYIGDDLTLEAKHKISKRFGNEIAVHECDDEHKLQRILDEDFLHKEQLEKLPKDKDALMDLAHKMTRASHLKTRKKKTMAHTGEALTPQERTRTLQRTNNRRGDKEALSDAAQKKKSAKHAKEAKRRETERKNKG